MTSELTIIGKPLPRPDGPAKVAGTARYIADLDIPGAWRAGVLRSEVPAGRLNGITRNPGFDWTRVVVITAEDLPGPNAVSMIRDDYEILVDKKITYATQALALVAAPDEDTLAAALAALSPDITPETPALTVEDALAGLSRVWGDTNVMDAFQVNRGDVEQGFAEADSIVENTYRTGYQEQLYLENQGMAAWPGENGGVVVTGSMQCPYYIRNALAKALNVAPERITVRQATTGGGFGGKEDYPSVLAVWVALLARRSGKPVRILYDRETDLLTTPKRHPSLIRHTMGLKKDGTITAVDIDLVLDGGACTTMSKVVLSRSLLHATGCYKAPNARIRARAVATNTPPNGAFRGFGAPQSLFAMERQMDAAASRLGLSPAAVRLKNVIRPGDSFPYGQVLNEGASGALVLEDVIARSGYLSKHKEHARQSGRIRKGIGLSLCLHGGGFTGSGEDTMGTTVEVEYLPSGLVEVLASSTDMGQGAGTVLPMAAAEALCLPFARVSHPLPDTSRVPNSGPTVASRTTMYVGRVVRMACEDMLDTLAGFLARKKNSAPPVFEKGLFRNQESTAASLDEAAAAFLAEHGRLKGRATLQPDPRFAWNDATYEGTAYKGYSWLAQVLEVEVDLDTYEIRTLRSTLSTEIGRAVNPVQVQGQMEGGVLQSYGYACLEDMGLTPDGAYNVSRLNGYLIPTTLDTPEFDLKVFEEPSPFGGYGAKGIGELSMDGGAPALAAAVENACGVFATEAPLTGEKLFALLEAAESTRTDGQGGL